MVETLWYYDGDKLQIDKEKNIVYLWYDYKDEYEEWFKIELSESSFNKYLNNEITAYDILTQGETSLFHRNYSTLNDTKFNKIIDFSKFEMPTKDSYLNIYN